MTRENPCNPSHNTPQPPEPLKPHVCELKVAIAQYISCFWFSIGVSRALPIPICSQAVSRCFTSVFSIEVARTGAFFATMPLNKRAAEDSSSLPNGSRKRNKQDGATADYSSDVRKKLQSSNRTGQACDRCRVSNPKPINIPTCLHDLIDAQNALRWTSRWLWTLHSKSNTMQNNRPNDRHRQ